MTDYVQQIYDFLFVKVEYGYFFLFVINHVHDFENRVV